MLQIFEVIGSYRFFYGGGEKKWVPEMLLLKKNDLNNDSASSWLLTASPSPIAKSSHKFCNPNSLVIQERADDRLVKALDRVDKTQK